MSERRGGSRARKGKVEEREIEKKWKRGDERVKEGEGKEGEKERRKRRGKGVKEGRIII